MDGALSNRPGMIAMPMARYELAYRLTPLTRLQSMSHSENI